jgi:hypothetical protein
MPYLEHPSSAHLEMAYRQATFDFFSYLFFFASSPTHIQSHQTRKEPHAWLLGME